jgi:adenine phosphoribosyltransferase
MDVAALQKLIKNYPDFPEKGVVFRDIAPILVDPDMFKFAIESMAEQVKALRVDKIAVVDARGFLFGGALANRLGKGLVMCRKPAKLPGELVTADYGYEYSQGSLSMQRTAVQPGDKILIVDDVLATGNTFLAAHQLINQLGGGVVTFLCLVELAYLNGRQLLEEHANNTPVRSVITINS